MTSHVSLPPQYVPPCPYLEATLSLPLPLLGEKTTMQGTRTGMGGVGVDGGWRWGMESKPNIEKERVVVHLYFCLKGRNERGGLEFSGKALWGGRDCDVRSYLSSKGWEGILALWSSFLSVLELGRQRGGESWSWRLDGVARARSSLAGYTYASSHLGEGLVDSLTLLHPPPLCPSIHRKLSHP